MAYLLQQLLATSAERYPDKPAVQARGRSLSYGELQTRSNQLAHLLRERGVRRGDRVGLFFPKAVESLVAMLGVLKAGAVYVPLDPHAPIRRVAGIAENCGIRALVTTAERSRSLEADALACTVLVSGDAHRDGEVPWTALDACPAGSPPEVGVEGDLAYILYTSGSTGQPKGVMLTHRNALTFVDWCAATFDIRPEDRLSNHAPLHFDLSVFDVYNALGAGATVSMIHEEIAVFPQRLAALIESQGLTVWYSVPSALVYLLLHGDLGGRDLDRLRLVLFAGEVFPMKYLRQLADLLPHVELYNLYGPTETNVCTYHRVDRWRLAGQDRLPIGRACANTETLALDPDGRPIGAGESGELYVRGPSVTPGYWGDPDKTRRALVPNELQPHLGERLYRTGDLVTADEHGEYLFLGRRDSQVKSRGYRIELGDIEAALYAHPAVAEAAVIAAPDDEIGSRLRGFVALKPGESLTAGALQAHCGGLVPRYMVPESIELRPHLPKTSTGKTDRTRLAAESEA
ncbi:MAG TPA: amino acid adenylation domain-containing protein [Candidatus Acidoferrum sp.]|jgi:amino acid adenylation domain-containing protein|nr:amino acid adenylation domain-containing protein [Candidatus Acidoferrum sp.]